MPIIRIGTRGSPLALAQAQEVRGELIKAHGWEESACTIQIIRTSGDVLLDQPLSVSGGKGLFTKEIEEALLAGEIDLAVHSAKDMPTTLPEGLTLTAVLERQDARDVLISHKASSLKDLPPGAVLGTASLRRQAMVKRQRSDIATTLLRGNVQTRLKKLDAGEIDAIILARAGLKRLGLESRITSILDPDIFLPAVGQGIICIEIRERDRRIQELLRAINHSPTHTALAAERAFLSAIEGSCRMPIAGHAIIEQNTLKFRGMVLSPDGARLHATECKGNVKDAETLGKSAGLELKAIIGPDFFGA